MSEMLGICFFTLGENTPIAPAQEGEKGVVGANVGGSAGQTVFHCHIHLIPRRDGDLDDPTGGVRNVIPGAGKY